MAASPIGICNRVPQQGVPQNFSVCFAVVSGPVSRYILGFSRGYRKTARENAGMVYGRRRLAWQNFIAARFPHS